MGVLVRAGLQVIKWEVVVQFALVSLGISHVSDGVRPSKVVNEAANATIAPKEIISFVHYIFK